LAKSITPMPNQSDPSKKKGGIPPPLISHAGYWQCENIAYSSSLGLVNADSIRLGLKR
jgi:hypothetical protein